MLDKLSDNELKQIYCMLPLDKKLKQILSNENSDETDIREHAFVIYWKRRLTERRMLNEHDIQSILEFFDIYPAKGILGEAASLGLLNKSQCKYLLKSLDEEEWAYRAILARLLIMDIILNSCANIVFVENENGKKIHILSIIDKLITLKMTWAIIELLPFVDSHELNKLQLKMENKSILTRSNRHLIKETISKTIKKRKRNDV